jgi:hypothetical protein
MSAKVKISVPKKEKEKKSPCANHTTKKEKGKKNPVA